MAEGNAGSERVGVAAADILREMLAETRRQVAEHDAYARCGRDLTVDELSAYEPVVFVRLAYGLIHRRKPELAELHRQLRSMRDGVPPLEQLRELGFSRPRALATGRIRRSGMLWRAQLARYLPFLRPRNSLKPTTRRR